MGQMVRPPQPRPWSDPHPCSVFALLFPFATVSGQCAPAEHHSGIAQGTPGGPRSSSSGTGAPSFG